MDQVRDKVCASVDASVRGHYNYTTTRAWAEGRCHGILFHCHGVALLGGEFKIPNWQLLAESLCQ